ncbi:hypothetical protein [Flavobacterium sp. PS2]|uniref:hypothetical protein n=1 Tax=Flavobacterium sp. PS2 TaxID=3384157 RepID=UPI00390C6B74
MIAFDNSQLTKLVQNEISVEELEIDFIKLGNHYSTIDIFEIIEIYINDPSIEGYNFENSNLTFKERLEKLKTLNGYIHFAGGLSCSVKDQKISNFTLTKKYIEPIINFNRENIIKYHGKPDYELIDDLSHGGFDYAIDSYILVYNNLNFYLDPNQDHLIEICTKKLDLKSFTIRQ